MSVLQRKQLEESPLADLHAIASELGIEGFRTLRRSDLIGAILHAQGAEEEPAGAAAADDLEPDEVPSEEALEGPSRVAAARVPDREPVGEEPEEAAPEAPEEGAEEAAAEAESAAEAPPAEEALASEPEAAEAAGAASEEAAAAPPAEAGAEAPAAPAAEAPPEEAPAAPPDEAPAAPPETIVSGVLDVLANGSGFLRVDPAGQSRDDVYIAPAQIRRCELRSGDEVRGPVRAPRRNERHPSLIRVATVNGGDAEPPEERPWFDDLTPVFATARLAAPSAPKAAPFGRGSRVAIAGPPGAGATALLHDIASDLEGLEDMAVRVVLVGVRPEEVTEWRRVEGLEVTGGSFDRSPEAQAQAAELAIERAKRIVERGGHAAVLIDSLDALPAAVQRRVFGAARATEEGGTLTVFATTGQRSDALRWATTRIVLEQNGKVARAESGTLQADRLA